MNPWWGPVLYYLEHWLLSWATKYRICLSLTRCGRNCWGNTGTSVSLGPLFLIFQSLFIPKVEGTGIQMVNPGQELQDSHLARFSVCSRTPQERIACWITAGHLPIFQILQLHQILGDELLGLPKYGVPLPGIDIHRTHEIPDVFLCGAVALNYPWVRKILWRRDSPHQ